MELQELIENIYSKKFLTEEEKTNRINILKEAFYQNKIDNKEKNLLYKEVEEPHYSFIKFAENTYNMINYIKNSKFIDNNEKIELIQSLKNELYKLELAVYESKSNLRYK